MKLILFIVMLSMSLFGMDKNEFIEKFKMVIEIENKKIENERNIVEKFFKGEKYLYKEIIHIKNKYKISSIHEKEEFLKKVDKIPMSLVLSQIAIESGWGKSRFSQKFNNFLGMKNKEGNFAKFSSIEENIYEYMINLNTHFAYKKFREKRYKYKNEYKHFGGIEASSTLLAYAESSYDYVALIKKVIENHNFSIFDKNLIHLY